VKQYVRSVLLALPLVPILLTSACSPGAVHEIQLAPLSELPAQMQNAAPRIREAYQFAVANPAALQNVPCYCGCVGMGHNNNYACYIKEARADGTLVFDEHALNCLVCVDISQDVMRLSREGKSAPAIRSFVISNYSRFGPPTQ